MSARITTHQDLALKRSDFARAVCLPLNLLSLYYYIFKCLKEFRSLVLFGLTTLSAAAPARLFAYLNIHFIWTQNASIIHDSDEDT